MQWLLRQRAQLLVDLIPVVPQRLDAVRALLGVEVALAKIARAAWMPCSTLSGGITRTRLPAAIIWSRMLRPVCKLGVPPSHGKWSVP